MGTGPLFGTRVVEFAGLGPGPLAGMLLADYGAEVVVIERPRPGAVGSFVPRRFLLTNRGKQLTVADLKSEPDRAAVLELVDHADVVIEGYRPGTMERLGLGPGPLHLRNPRLVYCRITGWGQEGPRAATAGHDIDYIATVGALDAIGRAGQPPLPPVNLLGDYAGGTMFAVVGILAALIEARRSGRGQVIDAAMADGAAALLAPMLGMLAAEVWRPIRGTNLFDTGAPFYDVYRSRDGLYLAIGALEDEFFAELAAGLGLTEQETGDRWNPNTWPALRARIAEVIGTRTRAEWVEVFSGTDACVAPVLSVAEACDDDHNRARRAFIEVAGVTHPAPAPRFGTTPAREPGPPPERTVPISGVVASWRRGDVTT
jgi:alpha-methylacyl-CoA racemase